MLIDARRVFKGKVVTVNIESVELPNGHRAELEIIHHPGGAAVAALDAAGRVCLLRQYRHAAAGWVWELPAGKLAPGEPPQRTAERELAEEAGLAAVRWQSLGEYLSSPGVLTEVVHLYVATGLTTVAAAPERGELLEVHWLPLEEAQRRAAEGEIRDGKTAVAMLRLAVLGQSVIP